MTITFNREQYTELLIKYQPRIIETEIEYRQALAIVEHFVFKKERTLEELALYDLAIVLVKDYESKICPMDDWRTQSPSEMLQYLLESPLDDVFVGSVALLRQTLRVGNACALRLRNENRHPNLIYAIV